MRVLIAFLFLSFFHTSAVAQVGITSPDKKITVQVSVNNEGAIKYSVRYMEQEVLRSSSLGLTTSTVDFSKGNNLLRATPVQQVNDTYMMVYAKKKQSNYTANKRTVQFKNKNDEALDIIFQVSNDAVSFRYQFKAKNNFSDNITNELTSFHFPSTAKAWLQPMQVSKTGWEQTNPAYEEHYVQDMPVGTKSPSAAGWVYPALFHSNDAWALITEASLETSDCATRLKAESPDGEYSIGYPDPREIITGKGLLPTFQSTYTSPWRIITIGSLATIIESTAGTDMAKPSTIKNNSFIIPGKSSWSWINSKDDFIVYDEQKKYIDFAAAMNWQYCLIDADWDRKIGYEKIKELADYAKTKNVGLLLWYNSAGDWNTVKYTPRNFLLTTESRAKEFQRLKDMGIKGVKIDFFAGDGQSVIAYYLDILKDAAKYELLVNFHGATLPRGWARTYPHLMTTEAVRGFEMITFEQADANKEATHCTMLPFTRNAFDPMDFTPMNLYKIQTRVQRKTTSAFELATSVLFLSGIQHFAESPAGMQQVPAKIQQFLKDLPTTWDDVKFIDGFPGKYIVIARKYKNKWYIAGINGEQTEKQLTLNLAAFGKRGTLTTDGETALSFSEKAITTKKKLDISMQAAGGFVIVLE
ncbi:glycoside hydrolase family 97 protein [Lacibacter sediminis]|uniref:Glycoside hydrolase family 97 catalytic domain-containing protein n=1 Tax=Lacibacter sediminis TaxID=2760713 RepID=A0A7G5XBA1_9BACT|nr:glycoside hydrolase family 97 protein [Lacibacter sediminis]QNA42754.1 glycoside hydrolase family 97 catalytic domain-containing protein [Lacibacter sediminis]